MSKRFLIVRKDLDLDEVVIESEGLTIGRLTGNDLVLNHPTVSRTQAGIKEVAGQFWVFNLSHANGTLLNGELIDTIPLADGDVLQIGPFLLNLRVRSEELLIEVEANLNVSPLDTTLGTATETPVNTGNTVLLNLPAYKRQGSDADDDDDAVVEPDGTPERRCPGIDEQALKVFWEKRKREAGKLTSNLPCNRRVRFGWGRPSSIGAQRLTFNAAGLGAFSLGGPLVLRFCR
jgi:pSer/pThr/pTyr-binding forkhead associated (FHA) protein